MSEMLYDRYEVIDEVGSGGFGTVYRCRDVVLERDVAIKVLNNPSDEHRHRDEISGLLQLRSSYVVQVYDAVFTDGFLHGIIEEYIDGEDLKESHVPTDSFDSYVKILWQIASGMADIHAARLVHRDIKPNNIKINNEGVVRIFDFGCCRSEGDDACTVGFVGTRGFSAPELFGHGDVFFDHKVDVYSFGATSLYLLTKGLPEPLRKLPPEPLPENAFTHPSIALSSELVAVLESCLATAPASRPEMSSVRDFISRYLLKDKHQAVAVHGGRSYSFNSANRSVRIKVPDLGGAVIKYDGLRFFVDSVEGDVFINLQRATPGMELPGSSVIAIGDESARGKRRFISFDIANPEVLL